MSKSQAGRSISGKLHSEHSAFASAKRNRPKWIALVECTVLLTLLASTVGAVRTELRPGVNFFTPEQDIQIGKQNAAQAEKQLHMLNDAKVDKYLNDLGLKLAAHAPGYKYPYQYRCVNGAAVNAFALPGGFVFINRGAIVMADNEAQLAGIMAHETSHVALRHGTSQATKAELTSVPFAILGGMLGTSSIGGLLGQLAANFSLNSILLRYSRTDESQADILGTQILYDSGYDPRAMSQFFEKLEAASKGKQPMQFLSDHPNSGNRAERVDEEVDKLGGPESNYVEDSPQFEEIKKYLKSLPPPPGSSPEQPASAGGKPAAPSKHLNKFQNDLIELRYPDNWMSSASGTAFSLSPQGGVVKDSGQSALAYGVMFNSFDPQSATGEHPSIGEATDQLIASLKKSNPNMSVLGQREQIEVGSGPALSQRLSNTSPAGGKESDWLVTMDRPEELLFFIFVAPENDFDAYQPAFDSIVKSVRFLNGK